MSKQLSPIVLHLPGPTPFQFLVHLGCDLIHFPSNSGVESLAVGFAFPLVPEQIDLVFSRIVGQFVDVLFPVPIVTNRLCSTVFFQSSKSRNIGMFCLKQKKKSNYTFY